MSQVTMNSRRTRTKFGIVSLVLFVTVSIIGVLAFNGQKRSIESLTKPCFQGFTQGVWYNDLTLELEVLLPNIEREEVTVDQISCVLDSLDFSPEALQTLQSQDAGRLDTEEFQMKWETKPLCEEGKLGGRYSSCSDDSQGRPSIELIFKDFR
jgi:hypothetical protein